jgi:purine-cytosine permease-like protein
MRLVVAAYVLTGWVGSVVAIAILAVFLLGWFVASYWLLSAVGLGVDWLIERRMDAHRRRIEDQGGWE